MALETVVNSIADLNTAWPTPTDLVKNGDDHIRVVKSAIKKTFPNINAPIAASDEDFRLFANTFTFADANLSINKPVDLKTHKISNVGDPTANQDAATKHYVDTRDALLVPKTTTINGHALSGNVALTPTDVGALPLTGGNLTGNLAIVGSGAQAIVDASTGNANMTLKLAGRNTWNMTTSATDKSFNITRYNDAGAAISNTLIINHATGNIDINGNLVANGAGASLVANASSGNANLGLQLAGKNVWDMAAISTDKSFNITRYNDAGVIINNPISISHTTGEIYINGVNHQGGDMFAHHVNPMTTDIFNLGNASLRWASLYAKNGTINTSDARLKTAIKPFTDNELAASIQLSKEIGSYQFLDSIKEKGSDKARHHIGMTVQRAIEIMKSHNLNPFDYGFICYDEWEGGDVYSFRYDQLNLFIARGFEHRLTLAGI